MAKKEKEQIKTPVWEWVIAAIGLILVIAAIGTAVYRAVTEEATVPMIAIEIESIDPAVSGYVVQFRVTNSSSQTAAGLTIEGQLKKGTEAVETSTSTLTYAPANSSRTGGLFFTKNPRDHEIIIRPTGYEKP